MTADRRVSFNHLADEWDLKDLRQTLRRELRMRSGQEALAKQIGVSRAVIRTIVVSGAVVQRRRALNFQKRAQMPIFSKPNPYP